MTRVSLANLDRRQDRRAISDRISGTASITALVVTLALTVPAMAQKNYGPGVSDTEIKIGNMSPYSGPASALSAIAKAQAAYFRKVNEEGGVNGRKINFISYDDGYSPPKAVEQARKLVESDEVLLIFSSFGTPSSAAIQKYMNTKRVPQLFAASGATRFGDYKNFPWTIGYQPTYQNEGRVFAKYILEKHPNAKIAFFSQNDDSGKDLIKGVRDGLGDKVKMIVADASYEMTDPTVDSQIVTLKNSGADLLVVLASPKAGAQTIRKVAELGWKPTFLLSHAVASIGTVLMPAGLDNAKGLISTSYYKDPTDPAWNDDAGTKGWTTFMDRYLPGGDKLNVSNVYGYITAQILVYVLKQCGDDLTRENVMKQATNIRGLANDMLIPGVRINTAPNDYYPIEQMQLMHFDGTRWNMFGEVLEGEVSN